MMPESLAKMLALMSGQVPMTDEQRREAMPMTAERFVELTERMYLLGDDEIAELTFTFRDNCKDDSASMFLKWVLDNRAEIFDKCEVRYIAGIAIPVAEPSRVVTLEVGK